MSKHDIAELLPFYANGTLDADERARVETELATCAECSAELRELEGLGASLKAHAASAKPLPAHILDDALARIAAPPPPAAVTTLRTAWWGGPARYATAAALVVGFGAAAVAAYHAHEADLTRATNGTGAADQVASTSVFRMTDAPRPMAVRKPANPVGAAGVPAQHDAAESEKTVAKQHRLAKKAHVDLLVRDVEVSLKAVQSIVRGAGGEIVSLSDSNPRTADAVHDAKLDVEVPADRLESTLDRIGTAGTVQNRAIEAEDVDAAIVDEEARLRNLRRAETDLRALMDKGGKVTDILTVQENLNEVRGQIEQLEAQHKNDVHRVATSTISIHMAEDRPNPTPVKSGPGARIDGAWHSGLNALADTVVALLSTIAWCVAYAPIPLTLAAITYAAVRFLKRRPAAV